MTECEFLDPCAVASGCTAAILGEGEFEVIGAVCGNLIEEVYKSVGGIGINVGLTVDLKGKAVAGACIDLIIEIDHDAFGECCGGGHDGNGVVNACISALDCIAVNDPGVIAGADEFIAVAGSIDNGADGIVDFNIAQICAVIACRTACILDILPGEGVITAAGNYAGEGRPAVGRARGKYGVRTDHELELICGIAADIVFKADLLESLSGCSTGKDGGGAVNACIAAVSDAGIYIHCPCIGSIGIEGNGGIAGAETVEFEDIGAAEQTCAAAGEAGRKSICFNDVGNIGNAHIGIVGFQHCCDCGYMGSSHRSTAHGCSAAAHPCADDVGAGSGDVNKVAVVGEP